MYGRSAAIFAAVAALSCANVVSQDAASGPDGKIKGAKPIVFDQNQANATGIVTYPGGDRVDWKTFDLPDKQRGKLDVKLTWQPPRPGEQLAFDVFDEWNDLVASSPKSKKKSHIHTRAASIEHASGKYFIRIYARERDDAGKYKLSLEFKPDAAGTAGGFDPRTLDVQDPPPIAAVPGVECTPFTFDVKDPGCAKVCPKPASLAPEGWPPCAGECTKPDVTNPKCWDTMECPEKPNKHVKKCTPDKWPKCDLSKPDPENPNCPDHMPPVTAQIVKREVVSGELVITIGAGSDQGITKDWSFKVLQGTSGENPLSNGDVHIIRIDRGKIVGSVKLTQQQVDDNPRVRITPPSIR